MLFGLRFDLRNPSFAGVTNQERYQAAIDMSAWAEERGGLYVSLSEHHGSDDGYLPSPLPLAAAIAARTSTIRIGINALIAPLHDPLRLAEDVAVVDLVSGGRLDLTLGAGYVPDEFAMFGVPLSERVPRIRETIAVLRAAWTGEPFEHRGRIVRVTPTPAQPGGPSIALGGSSEGAARRAARLADGFIPTDTRWWAPYRDECLKLGKPDPGPGMEIDPTNTVVSDDPEREWPLLGPYFLHETNEYAALQSRSDVESPYRPMADIHEVRASGRYRILTPTEYGEEMAVAELPFAMLHPMVGGIPPELAWEHLHRFEKAFL